jgi:hypothetical protein
VIPKKEIDPLFIIGVLNSNLIEKYLRQKSSAGFRGGYLNCEIRFLRDIPMLVASSASQISHASQISLYVEKIINIKNKLQNNKLSDRERERLEREIEANESRIDELVCELYGVDKIPN